MTTDDDKLSRSYRELAREEPPREVDEAILAAARRAAEARPAPLVVPSGRRRWYFPLAAAAIIVLAVAVTVQVERQQRDVEVAEAPVPVPPTAREEKPAPEKPSPAEQKRELFTPDPKPAPSQERSAGAAADSRELRAQRDAAPPADAQKAPSPAPASPPAAAPPEAPATGVRDSVRVDAAARPQPRAEAQGAMRQKAAELGALAHASPEQWLQGIADLRRQGRHEEADKALAEFRRAYPDYRIPEAMLEKVERQK
jgi:hypothetical protein